MFLLELTLSAYFIRGPPRQLALTSLDVIQLNSSLTFLLLIYFRYSVFILAALSSSQSQQICSGVCINNAGI